ncbi:hypothetical protein GLOIN_2v1482873 [Rhizophagus irregularis DAOM 181602=DAOM 197198]|nr:hypothetical protein GLOIN_2v1482873 [Rhizophagus irregularis DAOM 181602=DAOM 197198]
MSTYTELASIINSTDSISDKVIYDASHNQFTIVSDETVLKIIRALKDTIVVALVSGLAKPATLSRIIKLFPDNAAYTAKIAKIRESYKNKQALLDKLEALFELYYNVTKDSLTGPPKRAVTMNEAEKTLAELLA